MPSLIIPDTKTLPVYPVNANTYDNFYGCLLNWQTEDVPDGEGGTITRGEYLKQYLFDGKLDDVITFDYIENSHWSPHQFSAGMHIDAENNDDILSLYVATLNQNFVLHNPYANINDEDARASSGLNNWINANGIQYSNNPGGHISQIGVKMFDSFVVIMYIWNMYNGIWLSPGRYAQDECIYEIWDRTNNEIIAYNGELDWVSISTPEARSYARALTTDGSNATIGAPVFRQCSIEEVTYAPLTRIDGIEATRMYLLTQFPENCIWETLHVGDKYLLVLPYNQETSSVAYWGSGGHEMHCAIAIDVTEDIENQ